MNNFLDYVFYRSFIGQYKTKHKGDAEPRSIQLVLMYQIVFLVSPLMALSSILAIPAYHVRREVLLIFVLPIVFFAWRYIEKRYKKISDNNYQQLRNKFDGNRFNKLIPFWLIWIFPLVLFLVTALLIGMINGGGFVHV